MTPTVSRIGGLGAAMLLVASAALAAQGAPAAKPGAPAATAGTTAAPAAPATPPQPAEPYTYDPDGRRDPFVSLMAHGVETPAGTHSGGLSGLTTAELMVRGVLNSKGTYVALVSGPEGKTYTARVNDRLVDGTIRSITPQGLVIVQEVNDPLSLIKQREVRKGLRASEDGK